MTFSNADRKGELLAGKYLLGDVIGAGGMGVVYEATHKELRNRCAVKVVDPGRGDPAESRRLLREARALAQLSGPYSVRVLDAGHAEDGTPFLVMERLVGEPLSTLLSRSGPLRCSSAVEMAWQVAAAIREAHARGIIHRDLKPSNVFVTHDARVKVLDFGLATRSVRAPDDSTSTSSSFAGSPRYMSPEQIRSSADVTPSTDVWSLGVLLFEMVTGKLPFAAANTTGILAAIVADPATRLRELLPAASADLDRLVADCLEKNPSDRPSIEDVSLRLEQLQARSGAAPCQPEKAAGDSTLTSPPFAAQFPTLDRRPPRARLLLALAGGALLVVLAGALSFLRFAEPVSAPNLEVAVRAQPPLVARGEAETLPPPVPIAAPASPTVPVTASAIAAPSSSAAIRALPRRTREDAVRDAISTRH